MKLLKAFSQGDGAHCGLSDWYADGEAELMAALAAHEPFNTDWYSSKKDLVKQLSPVWIASARIWSMDGKTIRVAVSVSDDFDTIGKGESYASWSIEKIQWAIQDAWAEAAKDQEANAEYVGFSINKHSDEAFPGLMHSSWVESYLVDIGWGESIFPPSDYYHWWGWQHDQNSDGEGTPDSRIPTSTVVAFEKWAMSWCNRATKEKTLRIGEWEMIPWRSHPPEAREDPSDYAGMGWVGRDGRP